MTICVERGPILQMYWLLPNTAFEMYRPASCKETLEYASVTYQLKGQIFYLLTVYHLSINTPSFKLSKPNSSTSLLCDILWCYSLLTVLESHCTCSFSRDPFQAHRDHMRQMMRSFSEPFGGSLMPSITDGRQRGRDAGDHPHSSRALQENHRVRTRDWRNTSLKKLGLQLFEKN